MVVVSGLASERSAWDSLTLDSLLRGRGDAGFQSGEGCPHPERFKFQYQTNCAMLPRVKLTAQVKLLPTKEQAKALMETLERANTACDAISTAVWHGKVFGR